jgi:hypothetical protein
MRAILLSALALGALTSPAPAEPITLIDDQKANFILSEVQLDMVSAGVGEDLNSGYGVVTALQKPAGDNDSAVSSGLHPFTEETNVPSQAAASYDNPSFVADGQYTAGQGNPAPNVGNPNRP